MCAVPIRKFLFAAYEHSRKLPMVMMPLQLLLFIIFFSLCNSCRIIAMRVEERWVMTFGDF
jgi:hypothetical protein